MNYAHLFKWLHQKKNLSFLLLLLLAACGGGGSSYDYRVAMDPDWYSLGYQGTSAITGFSEELLQEIGRSEKIKFAKMNVSWDNLLEGLNKKQYEAILSTLEPYNFRQNRYTFSDLYLKTGPVLVVSAQSNVKTLDDLAGKEIALTNDAYAPLIEKTPGIIIRNYTQDAKALNDIASQKIDAALVSCLVASAYVNDIYKGQLKIITPPLNNEGLRLVALQGEHPELVEKFNKGLEKLKASKRYDALVKKWSLYTD